MEHHIYKEWIPLAVDNDLNDNEQIEFDKHLNECAECQAEYDGQKKLKLLLIDNTLPEPDDYLLFQARQQLRDALRKERSDKPSLKNLLGRIFTLRKFQFAFGGAALLIVGFFAGYLFFRTNPVQIVNGTDTNGMIETASHENSSGFDLSQNDVRITNIRFIDQDASDGEIEFIFDAVKPVRMKGSVNDEMIKNVLTYSMLNVENPGVRLNSINLISSESKAEPDSDIKDAVITVAKFDENPGVRLQAIKLLSNLSYDEKIKNTLLYVLMNDEISGNRVEAINCLMAAQKKGTGFTEDELSIFKKKMTADENRYIRYQAKTVLEESK